jgi:hypothetical protein
MKTFIIVLIFGILGYFAFQAFQNSAVINSPGEYEQQLRDENIEEFDDVPLTTGEALRGVNSEFKIETNTFLTPFLEKIKNWRIEINTYIDTHL